MSWSVLSENAKSNEARNTILVITASSTSKRISFAPEKVSLNWPCLRQIKRICWNIFSVGCKTCLSPFFNFKFKIIVHVLFYRQQEQYNSILPLIIKLGFLSEPEYGFATNTIFISETVHSFYVCGIFTQQLMSRDWLL